MSNMRKAFVIVLALVLVLAMTAAAFADTGLSTAKLKAMKPTSVKATTYSYSKIKVSWDTMDGVDGYQVYRATSKSGTYKKTYTTWDSDKTWYINTGRTTGKTYCYKVRGFKKIGGKTYYTKFSSVTSTYARPNTVKVDSITTSGNIWIAFNVDWKDVKGASGYQVYIREQGEDTYTRVGNFTESEATFDIPDTGKLYDVKVRAYCTVNGKKVYGYFSDIVNYEFDWNAEMLKKAGESYLLNTYPGITLKDSYADGTKKNPWDGKASWYACWPKYYCYYEPWEQVKKNLEETIKFDMDGYDNDLNYMCMYLDLENASTNYVHIFMIN